jgi:hypothetical protein
MSEVAIDSAEEMGVGLFSQPWFCFFWGDYL